MTHFCLSAIVHHPKSSFCRSHFWASLLSSFSFTHTEILFFSIEKLRNTMMCSSLCKHDKVVIFFEFSSGKSMLEREKWVPIELGGMRVYASIVTPFPGLNLEGFLKAFCKWRGPCISCVECVERVSITIILNPTLCKPCIFFSCLPK